MRECASATVFGQSMHLLVDESVKRAQIDEQLRKVGVGHSRFTNSPSLEDVFSSFRPSTLLTTEGGLMKHKSFAGSAQFCSRNSSSLARSNDAFLMFFSALIEMVAFGYALDNDVKHMAMLILTKTARLRVAS